MIKVSHVQVIASRLSEVAFNDASKIMPGPLERGIIAIMEKLEAKYASEAIANPVQPRPTPGSYAPNRSGMIKYEQNVSVSDNYSHTTYNLFFKIGGAIRREVHAKILADFKQQLNKLVKEPWQIGEWKNTATTAKGNKYSYLFTSTDGTNWSGFGFVRKALK